MAAPDELAASDAAPGDVVSMGGLDEDALPCLPVLVCAPADAATMLFSDDPETVTEDGVLYADTFGPGRARVYVYHVNGGTQARKFPVVVLNPGATDAQVTIRREAIGAPGTDYVGIGRGVVTDWEASAVDTVVTVPAGTRVLLDPALDAAHAGKDELVHAILDVDANAPVKVSVVSVLASEDAAVVTASLPLLGDDGLHDRGTFANADLLVVAAAGDGAASARHVRIGDGTTEPELSGTDATTGAAATLGGNYGLAYRFVVANESGGALRIAASERGGAWAGAEVVSAEATALPGASHALDSAVDAVWLATVPGDADLSLVSAGGSSLPVDVIFMTP